MAAASLRLILLIECPPRARAYEPVRCHAILRLKASHGLIQEIVVETFISLV